MPYKAIAFVPSRLLQDDPNMYGLPEGFEITDRSVVIFSRALLAPKNTI